MKSRNYLYLTPNFDRGASIRNPELEAFSERHSVALLVEDLTSFGASSAQPGGDHVGVVIEMANGWPWPAQLKLARQWLKAGKRAFFYWPVEQAIEVADAERLRSYRNLCGAVWVGTHALSLVRRFKAVGLVRRILGPASVAPHATGIDDTRPGMELTGLKDLVSSARPVALTPRLHRQDGRWRVAGHGAYLRTDYWNQINTGGSYGHTCHVAHELARASDQLTCFMAHRYGLLDEMGLRQVVVRPPFSESNEDALLQANPHFHMRLRAAMEAIQPAYIYERAVLGNFVGAQLSSELQIPYLLEYNGSEISMNKSFGGGRYAREAEYLQVEEAAFKQATVISVISDQVRDDVLARGIDPKKVLVNPNGVDLDAYSPPSPEEKSSVRASLGFAPDDRVIGFIGTFGGWHGIDTLAESLPLICERVDKARFLLIGDGDKRPLIDEVVNRHRLWGRVVFTGKVAQQDGARLLKACDVFVSPHNAHMVDSRFFGSPTKLFEYMGMGAGIVASDLEQIGEVLTPALRADALGQVVSVDLERAVLCRPGRTDEFVAGVVYLCERPDVAQALGRNARQAAVDTYAWPHHVQRLLAFAAGDNDAADIPKSPKVQEGGASVPLDTGDRYKDEVQNQWDNNPCGSQYVKTAQPHTLDWFLEVERYRYDEYGPWMPALMEFSQHGHKQLLEIGAGIGTDHSQFARHGAIVTDVDLSSGHLALARENFALRGLQGTFIHHDAETLPFPDASFDVVYSNGVIHHTPNTQRVVDEIFRVLRPGGRVIIMVYAENSLHYWRNLVGHLGLVQGQIYNRSIGHIMSESVEISENDAKPLVKVYTARRLRQMFERFHDIDISKCQLTPPEVPGVLGWLPVDTLGRWMGWNLVIKANKPA